MVVRSAQLGLDEAFCFAQGALVAYAYNATRGAQVIAPVHAGICLSGIALVEKLFYQVTKCVVPGSTAFLGPIPVGLKNIVSYGLATYTTLKIMCVAGIITSIPAAVTLVGYASIGLLVGSALKTLLKPQPKTDVEEVDVEEELLKHTQSPEFANKVFLIDCEGQTYAFRIINNPERKKIIFFHGRQGSFTRNDRYIISYDQNPPELLRNYISKFIGSSFSVLEISRNGQKPLAYTANPVVA